MVEFFSDSWPQPDATINGQMWSIKSVVSNDRWLESWRVAGGNEFTRQQLCLTPVTPN